MTERIAIAGCGLVGRACSTVFARAGYGTVMHDPFEGVANHAWEFIRKPLVDLQATDLLRGLSAPKVLSHMHIADTMAEAAGGYVHLQENRPEHVEIQRELP